MKKINLIPIIVLIAIFCFSDLANAQENIWQNYLIELADEETSEAQIESMYEYLKQLEENPFNLNTVSREDLEQFPLLSLEQATSLTDFLEKNRPVYTVYELRNVPRLDYKTVELILPFFYVGEMKVDNRLKLKDILQYGRNEVQLRFDKTLEKRAGYGTFTDSILQKYPNRKYQGEDFYNSVRYRFSYRDKISAGITMEKDAGEPLKKGYDNYGFHFVAKDLGKLQTIAIGDYTLSFGQGLVMNNNFLSPKAWASNNLIRNTTEPKRHFSTSEFNFFRGAATVLKIKNYSLTTFVSYQHRDANLSVADEITSFKVDGLHRTQLEIKKKNNVVELVTGGNLNYRKNNFQGGVCFIYYNFDKPIHPKDVPYNDFAFRGREGYNAGANYVYRFSRILFGGEFAMSANGALSTIHSLRYQPTNPHFGTVSFSYRNYDKKYHAPYAQPFAESGAQNETGIFISALFYPISKLTLSTYVDLFRYPYLRYQVDEPSKGIDMYMNSRYDFSKRNALEARYKVKIKEKNAKFPDSRMDMLLPYVIHKFRVLHNYLFASGWDTRTMIDMAVYQQQYSKIKRGWMLSENIGYRGKSKWRGDAFFGYFNSESYYARLFSYERNIFNTFYMPSFYGKGMRTALSARYDVNDKLSFSLKIAQTRYFDKDQIGSDTEMIDANHRTDLLTYLKWKF